MKKKHTGLKKRNPVARVVRQLRPKKLASKKAYDRKKLSEPDEQE